MKKKINTLLIFMLVFTLSSLTITISAKYFYYTFEGSARSRYRRVSSETVTKETNSPSGIEWLETDRNNSHTMYFGIWNETNKTWCREGIRFHTSEIGSYFEIERTYTKKGSDYSLWAKRQNIIDPTTYVYGSWRP